MNSDINHKGEDLHSLRTPISRLLFGALLEQNRPQKDYNCFRVAGLTSSFQPDSANFDTPIGMSKTLSPEVFWLKTRLKSGLPMVGENERLEDAIPPQYAGDKFDLKVVDTPYVDLLTKSVNAEVSSNKISELGLEIRKWWDRLESEVIMTHLAGMRGDNDRYHVLQDLQKPFSLQTIDGIPDQIDIYQNLPSKLSEYVHLNDLVKPHPHRHVASWQSKDEMLIDAPVTYAATTSFADVYSDEVLVDLFSNLYDFMSQGNNKRDEFKCKLTSITIGDKRKKATDFTPEQYYVMLVSPEIGEIIKQNKKWQRRQEGYALDEGYHKLISKNYIGELCNIFVLSDPIVPRFTIEHKGKTSRYTRAVILGKEALAAGYGTHNVEVKYKNKKTNKSGAVTIKTPYSTHVTYPTGGENVELLTQASFGAKVLTYVDSNNEKKYDRGRVVFDIRE